MEIPSPQTCGVTIYTKANCNYCLQAKRLVPEAVIVSADEYLKQDREKFLTFMDKLTGKTHRTFPMVFWNSRFIGGFDETKQYLQDMEEFTLEVDF